MDLMIWLETTALASWVRESPSLWAYPTILFLHTLGLAILVGMNSAIDLRIIGAARRLPLAPFQKFFPVMWTGFAINAASGALLTIADASTKLTNPVFYVKLLFIALALLNIRALRSHVFADPLIDKRPVPLSGKVLACTSLVFWAGAISAGRLMAYIGPVSGLGF